jgi:hypothetical protein
MKITDFPHARAVLQQIDFAQLLTEEDAHKAEKLAMELSRTCVLQSQINGINNYEVMLGLMLYLEQVCTDYCMVAGLKPKSRAA